MSEKRAGTSLKCFENNFSKTFRSPPLVREVLGLNSTKPPTHPVGQSKQSSSYLWQGEVKDSARTAWNRTSSYEKQRAIQTIKLSVPRPTSGCAVRASDSTGAYPFLLIILLRRELLLLSRFLTYIHNIMRTDGLKDLKFWLIKVINHYD